MKALIAEVLLQSPLPQLDRRFDYEVPEQFAEDILVGQRVKVPFGRRRRMLDGFVTALKHTTDYDGALAPIHRIVSVIPVMTEGTLVLAEHIAARQAGMTSDVLRLAIPPRVARVERSMLEHGGQIAISAATASTVEPRREVVQAGSGVRLLQHIWVPTWVARLATMAQQRASAHQPGLIIVPDYRDLDVLQEALEALGVERVVRLDAQQSSDTRYRAFLQILFGEADLVIGNRAAAYAPIPDLKWIAMWDDADPLYAEPLAPYAHSRDVLLLRQQLSGCDLMFFAHARSVAVERLLRVGWLTDGGVAKGPQVVAIDEIQRDDRSVVRGIDPVAVETLRTAAKDGPILIQVARRGYATLVVCHDCQQPLRCPNCTGPLYQPHRGAPPTCRWCSRTFRALSCPFCHSQEVTFVGAGTERAIEDVVRLVPGVPVVQATGDNVIQRVSDQPQLIIATAGAEPIPDGGYRAIYILDGQKALLRETLDASEQALRQWMNTAALAGEHGQVMIQGVSGLLARALATWRSELVASRELSERASLKYPPVVRFATLRGTTTALAKVWEHVEETFPEAVHADNVSRIGPVPIDEDTQQIIIRVPYVLAADIAALFKKSIIDAALHGKTLLRVRFDAQDI